MSDDQRLRENLSKLRALETCLGQHRISGPDVRSLMGSILREIDETILPRKVEFINNAGGALQFDVAGRRLLRVSGGTSDEGVDLKGELIGNALSDIDSPLVSALFSKLTELLSKTEALTVISEKTEGETDPSEIGCSAESLARAWGLDLYRTAKNDFKDVVRNLVTACADDAIAWIQLDSTKTTSSGGDPDKLEPLTQISQKQIAKFDAHLMQSPGDQATLGCLVLGPRSGNSPSLLYARYDETRAFVIITGESVSRVLSIWKELCSGS